MLKSASPFQLEERADMLPRRDDAGLRGRSGASVRTSRTRPGPGVSGRPDRRSGSPARVGDRASRDTPARHIGRRRRYRRRMSHLAMRAPRSPPAAAPAAQRGRHRRRPGTRPGSGKEVPRWPREPRRPFGVALDRRAIEREVDRSPDMDIVERRNREVHLQEHEPRRPIDLDATRQRPIPDHPKVLGSRSTATPTVRPGTSGAASSRTAADVDQLDPIGVGGAERVRRSVPRRVPHERNLRRRPSRDGLRAERLRRVEPVGALQHVRTEGGEVPHVVAGVIVGHPQGDRRGRRRCEAVDQVAGGFLQVGSPASDRREPPGPRSTPSPRRRKGRTP